MIDAGLPLVQCLEILATTRKIQAFQKCLPACGLGGRRLDAGQRHARYPKVFDDLTTNMIEAGETGGILDTILQRLSIYMEKAVKLRRPSSRR